MAKNIKSQLQLINSALNGASSSISLIKQLVRELEADIKSDDSRIDTRNIPGIVGKFDGESLVTDDKKKYHVNENYASKTKLVYGDTLKLVEHGDRKLFKQIERVKRQRVDGILAKKDGNWSVVTGDGSYKVLEVSISFHGGEEGDSVTLLLPRNNKNVPFGTIESIAGKEGKQKAAHPAGRPARAADESQKKAEAKSGLEEAKPDLTEAKKEKEVEKKETPAIKEKTRKKITAKKTLSKKAPGASKNPVSKRTTAKSTSKAKVSVKKPAVEEKEVPGEDELR